MFVGDFDERPGESRGAIGISSNELELSSHEKSVGAGRGMSAFGRARRRLRHSLISESDLPEQPKHFSEIGRRNNAWVLPEAKGEIAVSLWIENRDGLFEMAARRNEFTGEPVRHAPHAMCDARLAGLRPPLAVT